MNLKEIIPHLEIKTPLRILEEIVLFNSEKENLLKRVSITIGLSSGFIYQGIPVKIDTNGNTLFISKNESISYINTNTLSSLEILYPNTILDIITNGNYFDISEEKIPTNIELKRLLKSQYDNCVAKYELKINTDLLQKGLNSDVEKYQFKQFLIILEDILNVISKDSLGKEALNELTEINIYSTEESSITVQKEETIFSIKVNIKTKFKTDFKDLLKKEFESNL